MRNFFVIAVCVAFAVLRLTLPVRGLDARDVFKDLAHVWVGFLIGARRWKAAGILSLVELLAAVLR